MATNVDVALQAWKAGPRVKLLTGWVTSDGNGDEYVNTAGPFGTVVLGVSVVQRKPSGATLSLQLQHRATTGDSWANVGSALALTAAGEAVVVIPAVKARVRLVRDIGGTSPKYLLSQASLAPAHLALTPEELDSGTATVADVVAALVALGLVEDTA